MLDDILRTQFALPAEADTRDLIKILREIITDEYLQSQISSVVNDFFDYLQGKTSDFNPSIDLQPIKTSMTEENQVEFISALLQALPDCAPGELPTIGGENQNICKPQGISDETLMENYLAPAIPSIMAQLPDELPLGKEWQQWQRQERWRTFIPGMAVPASLILSVLMLAFVAVCLWYLTALIADSSWRGRLQWMGWSLLIPSVHHFRIGLSPKQQQCTVLVELLDPKWSCHAIPVCSGHTGNHPGSQRQHTSAHYQRIHDGWRRMRKPFARIDPVGIDDTAQGRRIKE